MSGLEEGLLSGQEATEAAGGHVAETLRLNDETVSALLLDPADLSDDGSEDQQGPLVSTASYGSKGRSQGPRGESFDIGADRFSRETMSLQGATARANTLWLMRCLVPAYVATAGLTMVGLYVVDKSDHDSDFTPDHLLLIRRARFGPVPLCMLWVLLLVLYYRLTRVAGAPALALLKPEDQFAANRTAWKYTLSLTDDYILARAPSPRALRRPWRVVDLFVVGQAVLAATFLIFLGASELFSTSVTEWELVAYFVGVRLVLRVVCMPVRHFATRFYGDSALGRFYALAIDHGVGSSVAPMIVFVVQMLVYSVFNSLNDSEVNSLVGIVTSASHLGLTVTVCIEEALLWLPYALFLKDSRSGTTLMRAQPPSMDVHAELRHLGFCMVYPILVSVMVPSVAAYGAGIVVVVAGLHWLRQGLFQTDHFCPRLFQHSLLHLLHISLYYLAIGAFAVYAVPPTTPMGQEGFAVEWPEAAAWLIWVLMASGVAFFAYVHKSPFGPHAGTESGAPVRKVVETQYYLHMLSCPDLLAAGTTFMPRTPLPPKKRVLRALGAWLFEIVMLEVVLGSVEIVHWVLGELADAAAGKACFAPYQDSANECESGALSLWYLWVGYPLALCILICMCFPAAYAVITVRDTHFSHTATLEGDPALMVRIPRQELLDELLRGCPFPEGSLPRMNFAKARMSSLSIGTALDDKLGRMRPRRGERTLLYNFLFRNRITIVELWNQHPFLVG